MLVLATLITPSPGTGYPLGAVPCPIRREGREWLPEVRLQVHPPVQEEPHALLLQEAALRAGIPDPKVRAARPALLDHPVAWNPGALRRAVHGPPNDPG
jgi:hypothetical protein